DERDRRESRPLQQPSHAIADVFDYRVHDLRTSSHLADMLFRLSLLRRSMLFLFRLSLLRRSMLFLFRLFLLRRSTMFIATYNPNFFRSARSDMSHRAPNGALLLL